MTSESKRQLEMPLEVAVEMPPFELVDRKNYGITEEILQLFKGSKSYILQWAAYGLISSEIPRRRLGLPDIGVPHEIVLGMTEAEAIAAYASIGKAKASLTELLRLQEVSEEQAISELVNTNFSINLQAFRQATKITGNHGYDTRMRGLVRRMRHVFNAKPELRKGFRDSALSTIVAPEEDRKHIWTLEPNDLIDYVDNGVAIKYQMAERNQ